MQSGLWVLSSPLVSGIGENQVKSEQITVYPNPAMDVLYLPQSVKSSVYQILDMQGKLVVVGNAVNSVEISGLSSGLYTILVQSDEAEYRSRFVKQ
jgi:hypothetical protein